MISLDGVSMKIRSFPIKESPPPNTKTNLKIVFDNGRRKRGAKSSCCWKRKYFAFSADVMLFSDLMKENANMHMSG